MMTPGGEEEEEGELVLPGVQVLDQGEGAARRLLPSA